MKKTLFYLLLVTLTGTAIAFAPLPVPAPPPQERTLRLEAGRYAYLPAEVAVNPGDTVTIELVSTDVAHGLYVDGYDLSVAADPGQIAHLRFVADKPGSFRFRCNVTCGAMHPFMIGKLNVGANLSLWRAIGLAMMALLAALVIGPHPANAKAV
jgi:heme/copper-type cytochrome/quinol oxidase subunit 2